MKTNSFYIGIILMILAFSFISCEKEEKEELEIEYGTFIDSRDGYEYKTVKIGDQWWMAENLNYDAASGSWVYDDNSANSDTYGRLYNWETACDVCPDGWYLPSDEEWKELEMYLGMSQAEADGIGYRGTDEGGKLKETGTTHWSSPNTGATNESGFSALPGGERLNGGLYENKGSYADFWSSAEGSSSGAWNRELNFDKSEVSRYSYIKESGFSVRCIRDLI